MAWRHTMTDVINNIADFIILSGLIPILLFIFRYATRSPFEKTPEGVNVLLTKIALAVILIVVVASLFLGQYPGREYVRLVAYTAPVVFFWIDLVQLIRIQRKYPFRRRLRK
jgi:hypothetical protein